MYKQIRFPVGIKSIKTGFEYIGPMEMNIKPKFNENSCLLYASDILRLSNKDSNEKLLEYQLRNKLNKLIVPPNKINQVVVVKTNNFFCASIMFYDGNSNYIINSLTPYKRIGIADIVKEVKNTPLAEEVNKTILQNTLDENWNKCPRMVVFATSDDGKDKWELNTLNLNEL